MTEQEQIEEIAKFMHFVTRKKDKDCEKTKCEQCWCSCKDDAERLYNAGYRIKPKRAVTIPAEERDEEMKEINKTLAECDELQELYIKYYNEAKNLRRKVAELKVKNEWLGERFRELKNVIGNVLLPCKVGNTVYWVDGKAIESYIVDSIALTPNKVLFDMHQVEPPYDIVLVGNESWGKNVFFTKEAAEKALKEMRKRVNGKDLCKKPIKNITMKLKKEEF